ncbi:hypothetical protein [Aquimarina aggregata]|uniref:hypothetical protein n=1 Tax=Aquimarina aggregata TaxID=1642818 RepID=UPI0024929CBD|nr:hypothetical protein [Aquimarina aggregata]
MKKLIIYTFLLLFILACDSSDNNKDEPLTSIEMLAEDLDFLTLLQENIRRADQIVNANNALDLVNDDLFNEELAEAMGFASIESLNNYYDKQIGIVNRLVSKYNYSKSDYLMTFEQEEQLKDYPENLSEDSCKCDIQYRCCYFNENLLNTWVKIECDRIESPELRYKCYIISDITTNIALQRCRENYNFCVEQELEAPCYVS